MKKLILLLAALCAVSSMAAFAGCNETTTEKAQPRTIVQEQNEDNTNDEQPVPEKPETPDLPDIGFKEPHRRHRNAPFPTPRTPNCPKH